LSCTLFENSNKLHQTAINEYVNCLANCQYDTLKAVMKFTDIPRDGGWLSLGSWIVLSE